MAIIAIAGGIYLLWGGIGLPASTWPWIAGIAAVSILCGVLLWLRVPAIKWLGVLVFVAMCALGVRRLMLGGWSIGAAVSIVLPLICAFWMGRIDYAHKFVDDE